MFGESSFVYLLPRSVYTRKPRKVCSEIYSEIRSETHFGKQVHASQVRLPPQFLYAKLETPGKENKTAAYVLKCCKITFAACCVRSVLCISKPTTKAQK